ncbi:class D beta-lactamase [Massilia sp. PAMC28688]|uniref:class D beta-lactamase n=1 Tax=Massilia sp. PAMC28688 TaxID=2861283 RepID=UPI001C635AEE|nr:class D beta-lactamase [Massilia sp. PAMC28688]QYF93140.1 class D beta-lactamase [Massilia sp. PAMC28688]
MTLLKVGVFALAAVATSVQAARLVDSPELARAFRHSGLTGTFVVYDVQADRMLVHNRKRANTRYFPASTFKIPNTLIGLSTGAVSSVDQVLPYGGKPQRLKVWEQDMPLREAIKVSNVPVYQELARRIGMQRMQEELPKLNYGNGKMGEVIDQFWLRGPLAISAVEQTRFLAKLSQDALPFSASAMAATRDIVLQCKTDNAALYAKTGWTEAPNPDIGWWVGWVRKEGRTYAFALNIDIVTDEDAAKRIPLGRAGLDALGVLPNQ